MEQKVIQLGAAMLTLALLLRLAAAWEAGRQEIGRTLLFFSTGRLVTETRPPVEETRPEPEEETLPTEPEDTPAFAVESDLGQAYGIDPPYPWQRKL